MPPPAAFKEFIVQQANFNILENILLKCFSSDSSCEADLQPQGSELASYSIF